MTDTCHIVDRVATIISSSAPAHDCWTLDAATRINTDCNHPLRATDPACSVCALRSKA